MIIKYDIWFVVLFSILWRTNSLDTSKKATFYDAVTIDSTEVWADSVYNTMSLDEKIGQLFMVAAYSNKDENHFASLEKLIAEYKIGGLIFFQGGPVRQAKLTNRFQAKSKIPLFIGIDAEWGLSMRLDSTHRYPFNMTLGAVKENELIQKMGAQMAQQSKRMGIHFTFGPVVDINTNPKNPIIGNRSFGEQRDRVSQKALAYMKGLQDNGILATAKHFPGHGDTSTDSHHTLPIVSFDKERIHSIELYPYKELIKEGIASVMVAHLSVPAFESNEQIPSSISKKIVTDLLQKNLGFKGLIFTDALNMKGASSFREPGEIDLAAFEAGNDILLFPENVPLAIQKIKEAMESGKISYSRLEHSVKKILNYKYKVGLHQYKPINLTNLYEDLNASNYVALNQKLYEQAVTTLINKDKILPIQHIENERIAYVKLGNTSHENFVNRLKDYTDITVLDSKNLDETLQQLKKFTKVIIGYHKEDGAWKNHSLTFKELLWIEKIALQNKVIVTLFTKPYSLEKLNRIDHIEGLILAYQNNIFTHQIVPQIIFGALPSVGKLPVSINDYFRATDGIETDALKRIGFDYPENVGFDPIQLAQIDTLINQAIKKKVTPGAQILVARKGKIVYYKSFGHQDYSKKVSVTNNQLYDIASLTKILATLPALMQMYEKNKFQFTTTLVELLPFYKGSNKQDASVVDILTHQARLQPWIPFYKETLDSLKKPSSKWYASTKSDEFPIQVTPSLYLKKGYNDTILASIKKSDLLQKTQYKYSDFAFIILKEYLEQEYKKTLDLVVKDNFYKKLGATSLTYNPLEYFSRDSIVPTEKDTYFRYEEIRGTVHDMAAAMQGGVSGHAGLFSNALDVAKMMQMFLQKGYYGGHHYFSSKTFDAFNTCYYCKDGNRRGLGFDKPQLGTEGPTCGCLSMTSFGHTGFTGTMTWADPKEEIVYVFLSNRTYPDSNAPNKLSKENVREHIQKIIYQAIKK